MNLGVMLALFGVFTSGALYAEDTWDPWDLGGPPGKWQLALGLGSGAAGGYGLEALAGDAHVRSKVDQFSYVGVQWDVRYYPWDNFPWNSVGFEIAGTAGGVYADQVATLQQYLFSLGILSAGILARGWLPQGETIWHSLYLGTGLDLTDISFGDARMRSLLTDVVKNSPVTRGISGYAKLGYTSYLLRYLFWEAEFELAGFRARIENVSRDLDAAYGILSVRAGVDF